MPEIEIRPATESDIASLVSIDHGYKSNYVWQMDLTREDSQFGVNFREIRLPRPMKVDYPRQPERLIQDWESRSVVLAGILAGEPVGYICLSDGMAPTTAWVTDLVVDPQARRQGIGSALVMAGQDWGSQRRHRRLVLEMQSKNMAAIRMAQKLGFEFCGYNDHYYENQDIALFFAQFLR